MKKPRIVSTFTGCGGMDLGFQREGYEVIWGNDFNESAVETYRNMIDENIVLGDIRDIDPSDSSTVPDADLVVGGFPCQDFSSIWKKPGLNGERGNYYKDFRDFVEAKKPKAFVAENVKGLLTANGGRAIATIMDDLEDIEPGYIVKPRLYNFAEYGVPQFRERLLIVGVRKDTGFDFRHPHPTHGPRGDQPYISSGLALDEVERVRQNNEMPRHAAKTIEMLKLIPEGENFTHLPKEHPNYVKGLISHVYRRLDRNRPSSTIIAGGGGGTFGYHFEEPRALTNRERARLQSFPDWFEFSGNKTEVRRQIGNAVPPQGVRSVARALKPLFESNYEPVDLDSETRRLRSMPLKQRLAESDLEALSNPLTELDPTEIIIEELKQTKRPIHVPSN